MGEEYRRLNPEETVALYKKHVVVPYRGMLVLNTTTDHILCCGMGIHVYDYMINNFKPPYSLSKAEEGMLEDVPNSYRDGYVKAFDTDLRNEHKAVHDQNQLRLDSQMPPYDQEEATIFRQGFRDAKQTLCLIAQDPKLALPEKAGGSIYDGLHPNLLAKKHEFVLYQEDY